MDKKEQDIALEAIATELTAVAISGLISQRPDLLKQDTVTFDIPLPETGGNNDVTNKFMLTITGCLRDINALEKNPQVQVSLRSSPPFMQFTLKPHNTEGLKNLEPDDAVQQLVRQNWLKPLNEKLGELYSRCSDETLLMLSTRELRLRGRPDDVIAPPTISTIQSTSYTHTHIPQDMNQLATQLFVGLDATGNSKKRSEKRPSTIPPVEKPVVLDSYERLRTQLTSAHNSPEPTRENEKKKKKKKKPATEATEAEMATVNESIKAAEAERKAKAEEAKIEAARVPKAADITHLQHLLSYKAPHEKEFEKELLADAVQTLAQALDVRDDKELELSSASSDKHSQVSMQRQLAKMLLSTGNVKRAADDVGLPKAIGSDTVDKNSKVLEARVKSNISFLTTRPNAVDFLKIQAQNTPGLLVLLRAAIESPETSCEIPNKKYIKDLKATSENITEHKGECSEFVVIPAFKTFLDSHGLDKRTDHLGTRPRTLAEAIQPRTLGESSSRDFTKFQR